MTEHRNSRAMRKGYLVRWFDAKVLLALLLAASCSDASSELEASSRGEVTRKTRWTLVHDEYFHPTSWTVAAVDATEDTTATALQGSGELGNSGFYRRMVHNLAPGGRIAVAHRLLGQTFDAKTRGAVTKVDVELDATLLPPALCGAEVEHRLALFQGGAMLLAAPTVIAHAGWRQLFSTGLAAESFHSAEGRTPDFGAQGEPIDFGFVRASVNHEPTAVAVHHGLANLNVVLHHEDGP